MTDFNLPILFYLSLPFIAFLYSSVGHGGASGYLALMAIFNAEPSHMKPVALVLNLFVAGLSFLLFWKKGHFKWKLFLPFVVTSVPASFLGGYFHLDAGMYRSLLAIFLFFSVLKLMGWLGPRNSSDKNQSVWLSLLLGGVIGLASGMIGIGGGIILSPIILILGWANMKETAAVSALFIWINSLAGLTGHIISGATIPADTWIFVAMAMAGALVGGFIGSRMVSNTQLQRILALVLFVAGFKLLFT